MNYDDIYIYYLINGFGYINIDLIKNISFYVHNVRYYSKSSFLQNINFKLFTRKQPKVYLPETTSEIKSISCNEVIYDIHNYNINKYEI